MNDLVKDFGKWLFEEGRAETTIESYTTDVRKYQEYMSEKANESQPLSRFSFVRYKQYLLDEKFSYSTVNKKINSLKVYNDFLQKKGFVGESYIQLKRDRVQIANGSEHVVTALTDKEIETLLYYVEDQTKVTQRNRLILYLLLYSGARISELVNIKLSDIDQLTATLTIRGKGGKVREVSLRQDVLQLIKQYRKEERATSRFQESEFLLVSQRVNKLHRDAVRDWLKNVSSDVGFHLHPHLFRHTFSTRLLRLGVDLTTVSKLIGHANINMTARYYIQTSKEEKQSAVEKL
jgi:integrase/recombinase XerD